MPVEVWTNDGLGTVTAGGTTAPAAGSPETWTVTATNAFPVAATGANPATQFYVCDQNTSFATEKILVTVAPGGTGAGQTWTVTRGADGTTPVSHTASFTIVQVVTRASLQAIAGIAPSGDASGVTDSANIVAALAGGPQRVRLQAGTFNVTQGQVVLGYGQYLFGAGKSATTIKLVGGVAGPAVTIFAAGGSTVSQFAGVSDLTIDGTSATANSVGLQFGDISQIALWDVACSNFGGGSGIGFRGLNQNTWSEQLHGSIYSVNCDHCFDFDNSGTGTGSWERMSLDVWGKPNASGTLVRFLNNAFVIDGRLAIRGNMTTGGACLTLAGTGASSIKTSQLDIGVEGDATVGTGPQTINFGGGSNVITDCYGLMEFLQIGGGIAWVASNNNGNLSYSGRVVGDVALTQKLTSTDWASTTTGFPAGWSGNISWKHNWDGDVMVRWNLTIANTTVVTAAETIYSSLPASFFFPTDNKLLAGTIQGGGVTNPYGPLQVSSTGVITWQGAAFTASGAAFLYGQATFPNSI